MTEAHDTRDLTESVHGEPGENAGVEGQPGEGFRLEDFAGAAPGGNGATPPPEGEGERAAESHPYTDQEVAELAATFTGLAIPSDRREDYHQAYVAEVAPLLTILEAGDALAELGIDKSNGIGSAPAWARALAAGVGIAYGTVRVRQQFTAKGDDTEHAPDDLGFDDWGGDDDGVGEGGGDYGAS